jgi:hypothetical protein
MRRCPCLSIFRAGKRLTPQRVRYAIENALNLMRPLRRERADAILYLINQCDAAIAWRRNAIYSTDQSDAAAVRWTDRHVLSLLSPGPLFALKRYDAAKLPNTAVAVFPDDVARLAREIVSALASGPRVVTAKGEAEAQKRIEAYFRRNAEAQTHAFNFRMNDGGNGR